MVNDVQQLLLHPERPFAAVSRDPYCKPRIDGQDERQDGRERHKPDIGDALDLDFVELIDGLDGTLYDCPNSFHGLRFSLPPSYDFVWHSVFMGCAITSTVYGDTYRMRVRTVRTRCDGSCVRN